MVILQLINVSFNVHHNHRYLLIIQLKLVCIFAQMRLTEHQLPEFAKFQLTVQQVTLQILSQNFVSPIALPLNKLMHKIRPKNVFLSVQVVVLLTILLTNV